jgi:hypothetical protein
VSLLCVLSFVVFDVLDISGSEFEPLKQVHIIKAGEARHGLRRIVVPDVPVAPTIASASDFRPPDRQQGIDTDAADRARPRTHRFPPALPRASLESSPLA